jgi:hypothetical protein
VLLLACVQQALIGFPDYHIVAVFHFPVYSGLANPFEIFIDFASELAFQIAAKGITGGTVIEPVITGGSLPEAWDHNQMMEVRTPAAQDESHLFCGQGALSTMAGE